MAFTVPTLFVDQPIHGYTIGYGNVDGTAIKLVKAAKTKRLRQKNVDLKAVRRGFETKIYIKKRKYNFQRIENSRMST